MRGDLTLIILEAIQATAMTSVELLDDLAWNSKSNWFRRSYGRMRKAKIRKPILEAQIAVLKKRIRFQKLISKLRAENFISKKGQRGLFYLNDRGLEKLNMLKLRVRRVYELRESKELKIIAFDIPESKKVYRNWLRDVLKRLKFKIIQKSVWAGKTAIPEELLDDLRSLGILECVEIFAVTKTGSLVRIE